MQVCDGLTHAQRPLCEACRAEPQAAAAILAARSMRLSGAHTLLVKVQVLLIHTVSLARSCWKKHIVRCILASGDVQELLLPDYSLRGCSNIMPCAT